MVEQVEMTARERLLDAAGTTVLRRWDSGDRHQRDHRRGGGGADELVQQLRLQAGADAGLHRGPASRSGLALYRAVPREASDRPRRVCWRCSTPTSTTPNLGYEHGFRGCGLLNAAAELPVGSPGRDVVRWHKEQVESILTDHLQVLTYTRACRRAGRALPYCCSRAVMARAGLEGQAARTTEAGGADRRRPWLLPQLNQVRLAGLLAISATSLLWGTTGTAATFAPCAGPIAVGAAALGIGGTAPGRRLPCQPSAMGTAGSSPASGWSSSPALPRWRSTRWPSTARCTPPVSRSAPWSLGRQPHSPPGCWNGSSTGRALSRWWMLAAGLGILGSALLCASRLGQGRRKRRLDGVGDRVGTGRRDRPTPSKICGPPTA